MKKEGISIFLLFASCLLSSCSNGGEKIINRKYYAFDTLINVYLPQNESNHFPSISKIIKDSNDLLDTYNAHQFGAYALNNEKQCAIDDDFRDLLVFCADFNEKTNGLFNALISPLKEIWDPIYSNDSSILPTKSKIDEAVGKIKESSFAIEGDMAILNGDAKLEFGAIGKGYCLSKIKKYLSESNINKYKIDAGSSSILLGESDNEDGFNVSIDHYSHKFKSKNSSISTSSIFEQSQEIDGVTYSHIINPLNGSPTPYFDCVVVECDDPLLGDALSTTLMMCDESGIQMFEEIFADSFKALVFKDDDLAYSSFGL